MSTFDQILLLVQGEAAADKVIRGIDRFEKMGVDLIVITQGGGAYDELSVFNSEKLARRIFECRIPVISAIGHERDFLIFDYVADRRKPTPTAAMAVGKMRKEVERELEKARDIIVVRVERFFELTERLADWAKSLRRELEMKFAGVEMELDNLK